jgi:hypothetical protein
VTRRIVGVVLILVGLLWIGQGIGLIGGSFMTGEAIWAFIGAGCAVFGFVLVRGARRED